MLKKEEKKKKRHAVIVCLYISDSGLIGLRDCDTLRGSLRIS